MHSKAQVGIDKRFALRVLSSPHLDTPYLKAWLIFYGGNWKSNPLRNESKSNFNVKVVRVQSIAKKIVSRAMGI